MNRRLLLVPAAVLVAVLLGWYLLLWSPQTSRLKAAQSKTAAVLSTRSQLDTQLAGLRLAQRNLPAEEAALANSLPALPTSASIDTAIDQIDQVAIATSVEWTSESQSISAAATPAAPAAAATPAAAGSTSAAAAAAAGSTVAGASTVTMALAVTGSYGAVTSFVTMLEERPRLFTIDSLSFSPSASTVALAMTAKIYYDSTPLPGVPAVAAGG